MPLVQRWEARPERHSRQLQMHLLWKTPPVRRVEILRCDIIRCPDRSTQFMRVLCRLMQQWVALEDCHLSDTFAPQTSKNSKLRSLPIWSAVSGDKVTIRSVSLLWPQCLLGWPLFHGVYGSEERNLPYIPNSPPHSNCNFVTFILGQRSPGE